jgi:gluconate 5-dehydrogenase
MTAAAIFSVAGKTALVTGAAQGLGLEMARTLAENGAAVGLFDRDAETLAKAAETLAATGAPIRTFAGDVADPDAPADAVAALVTEFGRLDIVVANAGLSDPTPARLHEADPADWHRVTEVNLQGAVHTVRPALAQMVRQGSGKVILVASMWGLAAPAGLSPRPAYAATKGALVNLARELALEYAADNIQVNALCPGFFRTATRPRGPEQEAAFRAFTPMGRIADAREIAGSLLYLASPASDFVTGTALVIDGGVLAR